MRFIAPTIRDVVIASVKMELFDIRGQVSSSGTSICRQSCRCGSCDQKQSDDPAAVTNRCRVCDLDRAGRDRTHHRNTVK
jgi:hypothetical protein